jgi:hypothetical protein
VSNHGTVAAAAGIAQERTMIGPVQALVEKVQAFADQQVAPDRDPDGGPLAGQRIAVLVPCYNEEAAIATVVADFRAALPAADIYVYDNNSHVPQITLFHTHSLSFKNLVAIGIS